MQSIIKKLIRLFIGLFVCAIGIVLTINANLGLAPWDVLHEGVSKNINITMGQASIVIGVIFVILDILLGENLGWGTIFNMMFVGVFMDFLMLNNIIPISSNFVMSIIMMLLGMFVLGIGCVLYIGAGIGSGPRDGMMIALNKRTNKSIRLIRTIMELGALVAGYLLGGTVGIGTIISGIGLGYIMQFTFKLCSFNTATIKHRYITDDINYIKNKFVKNKEDYESQIATDNEIE
ncbi:MAG: YczE/YyaS/YitT family protein [Paraclostridium sp.]